MNLLARAHGLQERIRPIMYLVSRGRLGNVRTVEGECEPTTRGREVLLVPNYYGIAPASKLSTREAGRVILNLLRDNWGLHSNSCKPGSIVDKLCLSLC